VSVLQKENSAILEKLVNHLDFSQWDAVLNEIQPGPWGKGQCLLGVASHLGYSDDIKVLVHYGADIEKKDAKGTFH
jgi:hypothetical protein